MSLLFRHHTILPPEFNCNEFANLAIMVTSAHAIASGFEREPIYVSIFIDKLCFRGKCGCVA
ncbi:MAG: hypothetical protein GQF41_3611 [Candidatus Rifleibacterium amylolyticum]|nr:MAG: hypothetical protein GQF41_3611 [Candidatus Rifleibacterium amylolyticum]